MQKRQENYAVGYKSISVNWLFFERIPDCAAKQQVSYKA